MTSIENLNQLYRNVSDNVAAATAEIADLNVEHKDGKKELSQMMEKLRGIQTRFDGELGLLEQNAEWDKFTMAFFGETNAGKSTIIESLRILFKEDERQRMLEENKQDLAQYEHTLAGHVQLVREGLKRVYEDYAAEISAIKQNTAALTRVLQEESSARMKCKLWLYAFGGFGMGGAVTVMLIRLIGGL